MALWLLSAVISSCASFESIDLAQSWNISCHNISVSADLPTYALQALRDQKLVPDPLYRSALPVLLEMAGVLSVAGFQLAQIAVSARLAIDHG